VASVGPRHRAGNDVRWFIEFLRIGRIDGHKDDVPNSFAACKVDVEEDFLERLADLPRHGGDRGAVIDFRHLITWLVRKPGAFAQYRWREAMFPSMPFRAAYDHLCRLHEPAKPTGITWIS